METATSIVSDDENVIESMLSVTGIIMGVIPFMLNEAIFR